MKADILESNADFKNRAQVLQAQLIRLLKCYKNLNKINKSFASIICIL